MSAHRRVLAVVVLATLGSGVAAVVLQSQPAADPARTRPAAAAAVVVPAAPPAGVVVAPPRVAPVKAVVKPKPVVKPVVKTAPRATAVKAKPKPVAKPVVKAKPKPVVKAKPRVPAESVVHRGQRVLASLHYDWQKLGYRIVFLPERKGYLGFTDGGTKTVTIWIRKRETDLVLAHTIAHELGHALDFSRGNDVKQRAYLTLRGMSPLADWYGCNGCTDYRTPAGDWAEVFAYWLAGPGDYRSQMGPPPDKAHMAAIAQLYKF